MTPFIGSLFAGLIVSLISFVGFAAFNLGKRRLSLFLEGMVAFAAGGLLGGVFFDLLPEAAASGALVYPMTLLGIVIFFVLDSVFWVYHCHAGHSLEAAGRAGSCPVKPVGYLNLVGDALHNFIDGVIVASAFAVSLPLGIVTSLNVALHEIPQEIGDYGVLLYSGFSPKKALVANFYVSLTMLLGIAGTFAAMNYVSGLSRYTIPFAAGGFIYMACTNLLSEIKEEESLRTRSIQFLFFLLGIGLLWTASVWLS